MGIALVDGLFVGAQWMAGGLVLVCIGGIGHLKPNQVILGKISLFLLFLSLGIIYGHISDSRRQELGKEFVLNKTTIFEGVVVSTKIGRGDWNQYIVEVEKASGETLWFNVSQRVLLYSRKAEKTWGYGQRLRFVNTLSKIKKSPFPGAFDGESYWENKGITYAGFVDAGQAVPIGVAEGGILGFFEKCRLKAEEYFDENLPSRESGLMKALVLGNKQGLEQETLHDFSRAGAMHILAVSGLHVGILFALLLYVLGLFPKYISKYTGFFIALFVLILYACISGGSASIFRAVFMFGLLGFGKVIGRSMKSVNLLFFSAFILVLWNKDYLYDLGFQLSYLAVLGILLFYNKVVHLWYVKTKLLRRLWEGTAIGIAATILTFPLTVYVFHQFPVYFVLTNLLLMFLTELLLIAGLIFLLLCSVGWAFGWAGWLLKGGVKGMLWVVEWVSSLPYAVAEGFDLKGWEVFLLLSLLLLVLWALYSKRMVLLHLTCFGVFLVLGGMQWKRWQNAQVCEMVLFPANSPLVSLKIQGKSFVFYTDQRKQKKLHYFLEAYGKVRPSEVHWCLLEPNKRMEVHTDYGKWAIENKKKVVEIITSNKTILLPMREAVFEKVSKHEEIVLLPWMSKRAGAHSLQDGAYICSLKKAESK